MLMTPHTTEGLVAISTTLPVLDNSVLVNLTTQSVPGWIRFIAAARMANTGPEWVAVMHSALFQTYLHSRGVLLGFSMLLGWKPCIRAIQQHASRRLYLTVVFMIHIPRSKVPT
jgi:hypothetical protein